jgi:hypothetical protein
MEYVHRRDILSLEILKKKESSDDDGDDDEGAAAADDDDDDDMAGLGNNLVQVLST